MITQYWNEKLIEETFKPTHKNRYVAFDMDQGGLNNIRLVFEYAMVIAAITRRTLILPPAQPWYLINKAAMGKTEGTTDFADVFQLSAINTAIPYLTTNAFCIKAKNHLKIPTRFSGNSFNGNVDHSHLQDWRQWLLTNSQMIDWNSYHSILCYPSIKCVLKSNHLENHYIDNRNFIELSPRHNASPIIYLPSDNDYRSLGPVATMLAAKSTQLPRYSRRLLKHHLRYRNEIFTWAKRICNWHQLDNFNAIHIRRNDFQYKQTRLDVHRIYQNIKSLIDMKMPLYIATDETDADFFKQLKDHFNVPFIYTIGDWLTRAGTDLPYVWEGPIEQVICARANRFIGTDLSTFSAYINRLRGYMQASDQGCYYHSVDYNNGLPEEIVFPGREYLRENPLFWQDC